MANINGNEIYFGIIGEIESGANAAGNITALTNGTINSNTGIAAFSQLLSTTNEQEEM